jgi:hypothetical protein
MVVQTVVIPLSSIYLVVQIYLVLVVMSQLAHAPRSLMRPLVVEPSIPVLIVIQWSVKPRQSLDSVVWNVLKFQIATHNREMVFLEKMVDKLMNKPASMPEDLGTQLSMRVVEPVLIVRVQSRLVDAVFSVGYVSEELLLTAVAHSFQTQTHSLLFLVTILRTSTPDHLVQM